LRGIPQVAGHVFAVQHGPPDVVRPHASKTITETEADSRA
jgi:hypothetical protein